MIKQQIINHILLRLDEKINELKENIDEAKESRDNENKSSVGDKYETDRAMVQMELEKNQVQLAKTEALKTSLLKVDLQKKYTKVEFGSLAETSQGNYFFSIAFGKIEIEGKTVFCLSPVSPVGKVLSGKKAGDMVKFGGLLGTAPVMAITPFSARHFLKRGGRLPAPITSMRN